MKSTTFCTAFRR